jgi:hypothetical protein
MWGQDTEGAIQLETKFLRLRAPVIVGSVVSVKFCKWVWNRQIDFVDYKGRELFPPKPLVAWCTPAGRERGRQGARVSAA